ncbi:MAG TPA: thiamine phosphate synthase [Negativicutes bacterium]|nr:thiamine phosphate synthase [Negativicutes bacterium]
MNKSQVNYSLYLVTDGGDKNIDTFCETVDQAVGGGVTLVQLREKTATSRDFYELALRIKAITDRHNVPLIINDRLDIALAVDADGLHIGQEDLPVAVARRLLGPNKILGATAATVKDAVAAQAGGADYLGSGAVYPTSTKQGKALLPLTTLSQIKQAVHIPVVAIGGISADNIGPVRQSGVDGVAVVSSIMNSPDPASTAKEMKRIWQRMS